VRASPITNYHEKQPSGQTNALRAVVSNVSRCVSAETNRNASAEKKQQSRKTAMERRSLLVPLAQLEHNNEACQ
jgi:hypothetical protein